MVSRSPSSPPDRLSAFTILFNPRSKMRTTRTSPQAPVDSSRMPRIDPELMDWVANGMRGQMPAQSEAPRPETANQPASHYPPRPAFPTRPRPPHVALNMEPTTPAPPTAPTFVQSYQPMVAAAPAPAQEGCNVKACVVPGVVFGAVTGLSMATYFIYRKVYFG